MPISSNRLIGCACVSLTALPWKKPLPRITSIIYNENNYNSKVDFNKLTQFSTLCLMWLEQSNYTAPPPPKVRVQHIIGFSNAFVWRLLEVDFPLLWASTCTSKSNNVSPHCFDTKHCFPICESRTAAQWNLWFHEWLRSTLMPHMLSIKSALHECHPVLLWVIYPVWI